MNEKELKTQLENGVTIQKIADLNDVSRSTVRYWMKKHNLKAKRKVKYTEEVLREAVKSSLCFAEVMRKVGGNTGGSVFQHVKRLVKKYNIDTSHFLGSAARAGEFQIGKCKKKTHKEILISGYKQRAKSHQLRRSLIEIGRPYVCEECGLGPTWNKKELKLQVDHINGDWSNCKEENLRFMCPNCHTQTPTYCGGNLGSKCENCDKKVSSKSTWCQQCAGIFGKRKRKVENRPSLETLLSEVEELGYAGTGRKHDVSDNTIRKWIKREQGLSS